MPVFTVLLVFTVIFDSANSNSTIRMHVLSAYSMRVAFMLFSTFLLIFTAIFDLLHIPGIDSKPLNFDLFDMFTSVKIA